MKVLLFLAVFVLASYGNQTDCDSSFQDDSDFQEGSGSASFTDDLGLTAHAKNDWQLLLTWNTSQHTAPPHGWHYQVYYHVQAEYHTPLGERAFTYSTSKSFLNRDHLILPLYTAGATYTIVLVARGAHKCHREKLVVNNLSGRADAVTYFQIRVRLYSYKSCTEKIESAKKSEKRIIEYLTEQLLDGFENSRFKSYHNLQLNLSYFDLLDVEIKCYERTFLDLSGRIEASGSHSATELLNLIKIWANTQPILKVRGESGVVNSTCPVYLASPRDQRCMPDLTNGQDFPPGYNPSLQSKGSRSNTALIIGLVVGIFLMLILLLAATVIAIKRRRRNLCYDERYQISAMSRPIVSTTLSREQPSPSDLRNPLEGHTMITVNEEHVQPNVLPTNLSLSALTAISS